MPINQKPHIHENVVCANIFVRKDGKYLLLKRSKKKKYAAGVLHPIGGKVDKNENPFVAAQREVLEEANITVKNMRLEAVILEINPPDDKESGCNWLVFHFSADYDSGEVGTTEEGELVLFETDKIKKQELFASVREVIDHILDPNDGTVFMTTVFDDDGNVIYKESKINQCVI